MAETEVIITKDQFGRDVTIPIDENGNIILYRATDDPNRIIDSDFRPLAKDKGSVGLGQQSYFSPNPMYSHKYESSGRKNYKFLTEIKPNQILATDFPVNNYPELVKVLNIPEEYTNQNWRQLVNNDKAMIAMGYEAGGKRFFNDNIQTFKDNGIKAFGSVSTGTGGQPFIEYEIIPLVKEGDTLGIKPIATLQTKEGFAAGKSPEAFIETSLDTPTNVVGAEVIDEAVNITESSGSIVDEIEGIQNKTLEKLRNSNDAFVAEQVDNIMARKINEVLPFVDTSLSRAEAIGISITGPQITTSADPTLNAFIDDIEKITGQNLDITEKRKLRQFLYDVSKGNDNLLNDKKSFIPDLIDGVDNSKLNNPGYKVWKNWQNSGAFRPKTILNMTVNEFEAFGKTPWVNLVEGLDKSGEVIDFRAISNVDLDIPDTPTNVVDDINKIGTLDYPNQWHNTPTVKLVEAISENNLDIFVKNSKGEFVKLELDDTARIGENAIQNSPKFDEGKSAIYSAIEELGDVDNPRYKLDLYSSNPDELAKLKKALSNVNFDPFVNPKGTPFQLLPDTPTNVVDDVSKLQNNINDYLNEIILDNPLRSADLAVDPLTLTLSDDGKFIDITEFVIDENYRNQGLGTEVFNRIKEFANNNNLSITTTPFVGELEDLVKKEGFVKEGNQYILKPDTPTNVVGNEFVDNILNANTQLVNNLPLSETVKNQFDNVVRNRAKNLATPGGVIDAVDVWEMGVLGLMITAIAYKEFDEIPTIFKRTATNMFNSMTSMYNIPPVPLEQYDLDYEFIEKVITTGEKVMPTDIIIKKVGEIAKGVGEKGLATGFGYVPTTPKNTDTMETTQKIQPGVQEEKMFEQLRPKKIKSAGGSGARIQ